MSYLTDTSVLIRTVHANSSFQQIALDALDELRKQKETLCIIPQNIIEFWVVATRPTASNGLGLTVEETKARIEQLKMLFILKSDQSDIFDNWESLVDRYRVAGKNAHDTRLVAAMKAHGISHILTFNTDDFKRFKDITTVVSPQEVLAAIQSDSN